MRKEMIRFAAAGAVGFIIDAGLLYLALWLGCGYFVGRAISFLCAVWGTWQINRHLTFRERRNASRSAWNEWWQYLGAMTIGGVVNYAVYSAVIVALPKGWWDAWTPLLAVGVGAAVGMTINFVSAKLWVFRGR